MSEIEKAKKLFFGMETIDEIAESMAILFQNTDSGFVEFQINDITNRKSMISRDFLPLPLESPDTIRQLVKKISGISISFGPAPRRRIPAKKGTDADVAEISCLWSKFSYDRIPGGILGTVEKIISLVPRPSITIQTESGKLVFYILKSPLKDTALIDWKKLNDRLNAIAGNDKPPNPSSLVSIIINDGKSGSKTSQPIISQNESSFLSYSLDELQVLTGLFTSHLLSENCDKDHSITIKSPTESELRERKVPAHVIAAIFRGEIDLTVNRSQSEEQKATGRDLDIIKTLIAKNFTKLEILALFENNPTGCGNYAERLRDKNNYFQKLFTEAGKETTNQSNNLADKSDFLPKGYVFDSQGAVWQEAVSENIKKAEPKLTFVSNSLLRITEIRENIDSGQISLAISYVYLKKTRSTVIQRSQMCNTRSLVSALADEGAPVNSNNARQLVSYFAAYEQDFADIIPRRKVTSKIGRTGESKRFLLPGVMADVEFEPSSVGDSAIYRAFSARKGSLADWVQIIDSLTRDNLMIPQIAVAAAFVPPLQKFLRIPNFILDIFGNTSSGKSTTLKLAASVFGNPFDPDSLIHQWMNTMIAVEQIAGMCSELPIYLDDAQHCSNESKRNVVYMIANGKGKGRSGGHGGLQETMTWRTVALSTSEEPLYEASRHDGVRSRLLPVGGFVAPFPPNSGKLVQTLERAVSQNHGFAGEIFVRHLNSWRPTEWSKWERRYNLLRQELAGGSASDLLGRVSGYIAAIGVAAEIASPLLGLHFKSDVIVAWLSAHLQEQQGNQNIVLAALRVLADFYLSNQASFAGTKEYADSRKVMHGVSRKGEYVGFTRSTLDIIFTKRRWSQSAVLQKMSEASILLVTESDRYTKKVAFGDVNHRLVCIKWTILLPDNFE